MKSLMNSKLSSTPKGHVTYIAFVWLPPSMNSDEQKRLKYTQSLATYTTIIWFLPSMNSLMNSKVATTTKCFDTHSMFLCLLPNMNSPINCKA